MIEILKTFLFLPVLNPLEANRDSVRVIRRPGVGAGGGGGGTPLPGPGLKGNVPLNKLVFKNSSESQKSTISLFSITIISLSGCIFGPEAV